MKIKGRVLRIERSSSYDGEGLRTVVFLKGCTLGCLWCSTPESQKHTYEIGCDDSKCLSCGLCIRECPHDALRADENGFPRAVDNKCTGCGVCIGNCPARALSIYGYDMTAEEVVREIEKDGVFYFHSRGGFTFSGGEPLLQPEFVAEVFRLAAEHGISGTVETCANVPWSNIKKVLPWVPKLFVDIKHMDPKCHKDLTGVSNDLILENIRRINDCGTKMCVRVPLIPTMNDSVSNLNATAEFCRVLDNVVELELLSYHKLGMTSYRRLGRGMALEHIDSPTQESVLCIGQKLKTLLPRTTIKINGAII